MTEPRLSRSDWLAAAAAGAATLAARPARAQAPALVRIGTSASEANADVFYAVDQGYFDRVGLAVDVKVLLNGPAIAAAMVGGSLDVGSSSPFVFMNAFRHGLPFTMIAPGAIYESALPGTLLCVAAGSPIKTAKDLAGKIVAGISLGALDQLSIFAWLDQNGGDSTTVKMVEVPPSTMTEALESGRVSAALIPEPQLSAAGNRVVAIGKAYDAIAKVFMISNWFATTDWAAKNPVALGKFREAMAQTGQWSAANPEKAAVILEKWIKIKEPRIRTHMAPKLDVAMIQPICDLAYKYKMIDAPISAADFIWNASSVPRRTLSVRAE